MQVPYSGPASEAGRAPRHQYGQARRIVDRVLGWWSLCGRAETEYGEPRSVSDVDPADPYVEPLTRYNATMAGLLGAGESAPMSAPSSPQSREKPRRTSAISPPPGATGLAARKLVDPIGDSVVAATSAFPHQGVPGPSPSQ